jgi:hypothetical protein
MAYQVEKLWVTSGALLLVGGSRVHPTESQTLIKPFFLSPLLTPLFHICLVSFSLAQLARHTRYATKPRCFAGM